jgi:hypothetical protein
MASADPDDLTKLAPTAEDTTAGTGIFDVLMSTVDAHIQKQFDENRLSGAEFAKVYTAAIQATLTQSVQYLTAFQQSELLAAQALTEVKKSEDGGLIDLEKRKLQEEIDLVIAQTAAAYEGVKASEQDTVRRNSKNTKEVIKIDMETDLVVQETLDFKSEITRREERFVKQQLDLDQNITIKVTQIDEIEKASQLKAGQTEEIVKESARRDDMLVNELLDIAQSTALKAKQVTEISAESERKDDMLVKQLLDVTQSTALTASQIDEIESESTRKDAKQVKELLDIAASTALKEGQTEEISTESTRKEAIKTSQVGVATSTVSKDTAQINELATDSGRKTSESSAKVTLMGKQADGFDHDAKTKLLKQMTEMFSVGYAVKSNGEVTIPDSAKQVAIDKLVDNQMQALGLSALGTP